jgi:hypothetical protein
MISINNAHAAGEEIEAQMVISGNRRFTDFLLLFEYTKKCIGFLKD